MSRPPVITILPRAKGAPELSDKALHGCFGDWARLIVEHTEADIAPVLLQSLIAYGNCIGGSAFYLIGTEKHRTNLYVLTIGPTSRGRKGISLNGALLPFRTDDGLIGVDDTWVKYCLLNTLASGEGIVHRLRDASGDDPGASDKRLLVTATELASVLRKKKREGNTLSDTLRDGWDGIPLSNPTRTLPEAASDYLLSVIGHITPGELTTLLEAADITNGFWNRFLFCFSQSGKSISRPLALPAQARQDFTEQIRASVSFGKKAGQVVMNELAEELWDSEIHPELTSDTLGETSTCDVLARNLPMVLRLATIYTLADNEIQILPVHLEAALAVYRYHRDSVEIHMSDETPAERLFRRVLSLIANRGELTMTELHRLLGNNIPSVELQACLHMLEAAGRIKSRTERKTGGRPAVYVAIVRAHQETTAVDMNEERSNGDHA